MIEEIYAVTKDRKIWRISTKLIMEVTPTVQEIGGKERILRHGNRVAITSKGVFLYFSSDKPDPIEPRFRIQQTIEDVMHYEISERTAETIGYFLSKERAEETLEGKLDILEIEDETIAAMKAIGANHKYFIISREKPFGFDSHFYTMSGVSQNSMPKISRVDAGLSDTLKKRPRKRGEPSPPLATRSKVIATPPQEKTKMLQKDGLQVIKPDKDVQGDTVLDREIWILKYPKKVYRFLGPRAYEPFTMAVGEYQMILVKVEGDEWWVIEKGYPKYTIGDHKETLEMWDAANTEIRGTIPSEKLIQRIRIAKKAAKV